MTWQRRLTPEGAVQKAVKTWLQYHGWFVFKNHQSMGSYPGVADLCATKAGVTVWIEIKKPADGKKKQGEQSDHQRQFEADIKAHGGKYLVARGIEDVKGL